MKKRRTLKWMVREFARYKKDLLKCKANKVWKIENKVNGGI